MTPEREIELARHFDIPLASAFRAFAVHQAIMVEYLRGRWPDAAEGETAILWLTQSHKGRESVACERYLISSFPKVVYASHHS